MLTSHKKQLKFFNIFSTVAIKNQFFYFVGNLAIKWYSFCKKQFIKSKINTSQFNLELLVHFLSIVFSFCNKLFGSDWAAK